MSFWSNEHIAREAYRLIEPFQPDRLKECAYDLALGPEAYVTPGDSRVPSGEWGKKLILDHGEQLIIPPGQFALLLTEERVTIPNYAIGFISVKSKFKLHGLVNVSGFHVDPGFSGNLIFSVYNAGGNDFIVSRGDPLFLLWVASLDKPTKDTFSGPRQGQTGIPGDDIMRLGRPQFSPSAVAQRVSTLEERVVLLFQLLVGLVVAVITGVVLFFLQQT